MLAAFAPLLCEFTSKNDHVPFVIISAMPPARRVVQNSLNSVNLNFIS
jgi:hypothetical protein